MKPNLLVQVQQRKDGDLIYYYLSPGEKFDLSLCKWGWQFHPECPCVGQGGLAVPKTEEINKMLF